MPPSCCCAALCIPQAAWRPASRPSVSGCRACTNSIGKACCDPAHRCSTFDLPVKFSAIHARHMQVRGGATFHARAVRGLAQHRIQYNDAVVRLIRESAEKYQTHVLKPCTMLAIHLKPPALQVRTSNRSAACRSRSTDPDAVSGRAST